MNTTERLVESYYRQKGHFTITDAMVKDGNNRQFDILTIDNKASQYYHIEVNVTHDLRFVRPFDSISAEMRAKFFGVPKNKRPGNPNTDFAKGKSYLDAIKRTYNSLGMDFNLIKRVWCTWSLSFLDQANVDNWKEDMGREFGLDPQNFEILLFRDEVLTTLMRNIGTSNYSDELLRTLSLIDQHKGQTPFI
ncbi:MAG: hypothetical protein Q8M15_16960 [Bacteroidota bacterium]|nr:hypothetical protein [Bacteroidota bacterium]